MFISVSTTMLAPPNCNDTGPGDKRGINPPTLIDEFKFGSTAYSRIEYDTMPKDITKR